MHLKTLYIRFYKSFNDDFLRKNDQRYNPKPWEKIEDVSYPYIEIPIEKEITTIVGANESGKSHLLSAIKKAITGDGIERSDFCRYSHFFTVKTNQLKYPDFGTEWTGISKNEQEKLIEILSEIINPTETLTFSSFMLFRNNKRDLTIYIPDGNNNKYRSCKIKNSRVNDLKSLLPKILEIKSDVALPTSVPIQVLANFASNEALDDEIVFDELDFNPRNFEMCSSDERNKILQALYTLGNPDIVESVKDIMGNRNSSVSPEFINALKNIQSILKSHNLNKQDHLESHQLAYKLICKIGQVDPRVLSDLSNAIREGKHGYANGVIEKINRQLSANLNFPRYWVQDKEFCLRVMARDYDLVFTITDRTGTEYSFNERSQGLRHFLSYYIQYRSHTQDPEACEILLMDEPDAYLSSQAQQDLLKIFELFAQPEKGSHIKTPIQVVYVTHSPFLIDKNHSGRIRVLQKGSDDEGTRVVKDAAKNHYEPLRSSIGPYVGETTFIGNCNLMVEGVSDQILLAGVATYLGVQDVSSRETLDLNHLTIVPSGSASHIPYLVYLARGRDVEQPAIIVLLDSDKSGNDARDQLLGKQGKYKKPILKKDYILMLNDIREKLKLNGTSKAVLLEIEDLIPLDICVESTKRYLEEFLNVDTSELEFLTPELLTKNVKAEAETTIDLIQRLIFENSKVLQGIKINKIGFARNIIKVINRHKNLESIADLKHNFKELFKRINSLQLEARQILNKEKLSTKIARIMSEFTRQHPISARREDGLDLLDEISLLVKNEQIIAEKEKEAVIKGIDNLKNDHNLEFDMNKIIDDFDGFKTGLERVKYAGLIESQAE